MTQPVADQAVNRTVKCSAQICSANITEATFRKKFIEIDGCWIWQGRKNNMGYGWQCHFLAHRLSWTFNVGPIPKGLKVLHRCDVPSCVNPAHLFLGTQTDNLLDMRIKQRGAIPSPMFGESNPFAKLTDDKVRHIRQLYATGKFSQREVGLIVGTTRASVCGVVTGRVWAHVK